MASGEENPYAPPEPAAGVPRRVRGLRAPLLILACKCCFWTGLALAFLGLLIAFYPGAESEWFLAAAMLLAVGVFVPSRSYRFLAVVGCCVCLAASYSGYCRKTDYQKWLHLSRDVDPTAFAAELQQVG